MESNKLPSPAKRLASKADKLGWYTTAAVGTGLFDGKETSSAVVRGWRGEGRFVAVWLHDPALASDGFKSHAAYFWTREHSAAIRHLDAVKVWSKANSYSEEMATKFVRPRLPPRGKQRYGDEDTSRDELVDWTSSVPTPEKIGMAELSRMLT